MVYCSVGGSCRQYSQHHLRVLPTGNSRHTNTVLLDETTLRTHTYRWSLEQLESHKVLIPYSLFPKNFDADRLWLLCQKLLEQQSTTQINVLHHNFASHYCNCHQELTSVLFRHGLEEIWPPVARIFVLGPKSQVETMTLLHAFNGWSGEILQATAWN